MTDPARKFRPVERQSLSERVFDQLKGQIVQGEMSPGDALPAERALCEMLQVNRQSLREALQRLAQLRLVSIQHGDSTRVLDYREHGGMDLLPDLLLASDGTPVPDVVRSILEMRTVVAADAARCVALREPERAEALANVAREMRAAGDDLSILQELNIVFWREVIRGSRNVAYALAYNSLQLTYGRVRDLLGEVLREELTAFDAYDALAHAVGASQPDEARRVAQEIVTLGERAFSSILAVFDDEKGQADASGGG